MIDLNRRLFLKVAGALPAALAVGKLPEVEAKEPDLPIPSDCVEGYDYPEEMDMGYVERAIRVFPHHGKMGIDVVKPIQVLHLHRFMAELLDDAVYKGGVLDITSNNFSWRHTDTIFTFDHKHYTVSPRSFKNLRNAGVIYGYHRFFTVERVGIKQGPIRVNGMPFINRQLLHCKKFHHFTHKPFKNRPWQDMEYRMVGEGKEYEAYKYVIPV